MLFYKLNLICYFLPMNIFTTRYIILSPNRYLTFQTDKICQSNSGLFLPYLWSEIHLVAPRIIFRNFKGPTLIYHSPHLRALSLFLIHFIVFLSKLIWQFLYTYLNHYINHYIEVLTFIILMQDDYTLASSLHHINTK